MQASDLLFSSQEAKSLSVKVSNCESPAALSIEELIHGPPWSQLKERMVPGVDLR